MTTHEAMEIMEDAIVVAQLAGMELILEELYDNTLNINIQGENFKLVVTR